MTAIGIDLGTTNSLIAYVEDGIAKIIPNVHGNNLTPSVVGINDNDEVIVGEAAKNRLQTHPEKSYAYFKRYMGTDKVFTLGNREFRPEELSAMILRSLKNDAEVVLGAEIHDVVISVPAYFSDAQRKATHNAGKLAGLNVMRLINEPTAAAMAYSLHDKVDESNFLVFDLGGGTFDVSVLEVFSDVMQVHASAGDNFLGGEDFTEILVSYFVKELGAAAELLTLKDKARLYSAAEKCKHKLSNDESTSIDYVLNGEKIKLEITRNNYVGLCENLLQRLRIPAERALRDASFNARDLDAVVLVGGASRMPVIRTLSSKLFGQIPYSHINPDEVVVLGAATQAGMVKNEKGIGEVILTDVSPYTLGTSVVNHANDGLLFHPIIERNTPVPVSRNDILNTAFDYQTVVNINVYQGESRNVSENIHLGNVSIDVPRAKAGEQQIEVRFTYDVNGLLEVELVSLTTGRRERIVIEDNPGVLSQNEIEAKLKEIEGLKIHPRDKAENTALLAKAGRMYEENIGETRDYINQLITKFEYVLNKQDPNEVESMRIQINKILDEIDYDPFS